MGMLDALLYGIRDLFDSDDNQLPRRSRVKFTGTVTDDPTNDRIVVDTSGIGGGGAPGTPDKSLQYRHNGSTFKGLENWNREGIGHLNTERRSMTGFPELVFNAGAKTITRGSGSFVTDGFTTGPITIRNIASPYQTANNGTKTVTLVSASVLTLSDSVTTDDIAADDVLNYAITIEQGGYQTVGLPSQTAGDQGERRVSQLNSQEPDRVIDSMIDSDGNTIPLLAISRNDEVMSGALYDQINSAPGLTVRTARLEAWGVRNSDVEKERWVDGAREFSEKTRGFTSTNTDTPSNIVWAQSWTGNVKTVVTVRAESSLARKYWTFVNGVLEDTVDPNGKSWDVTFDGTSSATPVVCTGDNTSGTIGWYATVDKYGNAGGGTSGARKYFLDPRDFGAKWDGVTDDLAALQRMHDSIPSSRTTITTVQLPPGTGYCSDNWHISRRLDIRGYGHEEVNTNTGQTYNGIKFAPMKGLIFDGPYTAPDYDGSGVQRADGSRLSHASIMSTQCVVTDEGSNTGALYRLLSTTADVWANLPTTVPKGTVVLRSGATNGFNGDYISDGATRDTTHVVMFRCTTSGSKGSAEPGAFATKGIADIGTTVTATSGTAVWTVESVPKDYVNNHAYVVGQRVVVPGDPDHVFECVVAGTSIVATPGLNFNVYGIPTRIPWMMFQPTYSAKFFDTMTLVTSGGTLPTGTINVIDTADFPSSGTIQVLKNDGAYAAVTYTGKTSTSFTGCTGGSGTFSGQIGKTGLKWKCIAGPELVTMLSSTCHLENVSLLGSTGCAMFITSGADLETYPAGGGTTGTADFWGLKDATIAFCGSGITINGNDTNQGHTSHIQQKFMGTGRTNTDGASYFNISAPGKWGNGACAIKDRTLGASYHNDSYPEFSAGIPYRNDLFSTYAFPLGNFSTFVRMGNEAGWSGTLSPLFHHPAQVFQCAGVPLSEGAATIIDADHGRNIRCTNKLASSSAHAVAIWGTHFDGVAAAFSAFLDTDAYQTALNVTDDMTYFPAKWWSMGVANQSGDQTLQAFLFPRPNASATWPSTTSIGTDYPLWIPQSRVWIGSVVSGDPPSIGFSGGAPAAGYYVLGAVSFQLSAAVGSPIGYVTTATGSPGTQVALPALEDAALARTRQTKAQWKDDAVTSPTAAKTNVYSGRVTGSTSATTANQVLATITLANSATSVVDVVVTGKLPASNSGATCKLSGSFSANGSLTRLGTDDVGTVKGTGSAGTPTFDLNINSMDIQVRVTPSSASQTDWAVVYQVTEGTN